VAVLALALIVIWVLLVAGVRGYLRYRRTGDFGVAFRDRRGSAQWWARLISTIGIGLAIGAPLADLAGLPPLEPLDHPVVAGIGVALVCLGIAGTMAAQWVMGDSWRGDVDPAARTALVTTGPFRVVRTPILTATATTGIGLALMVPNAISAAMLVAFVLAQEIQVRLVEEPYLLRVHGDAYREYAARTGRFLPLLGRLRDGETSDGPDASRPPRERGST
jgi:protein-S-isoprenylcysteine O-methyltransferase Ste14